MTFTRLSTLKCLDWLRQKTRTSSASAAQNGEWTDAKIIVQLNAAIREIVTRMLTSPWAPYFITTEIDQITTNGVLVVGNSLTIPYSVIKVAFVQWGLGETDVGKFVPILSVNRVAYTASYQSRGGAKVMGDAPFLICRTIGHETGNTQIILQFFNNAGVEHKLTPYFYCYPSELTGADPPNEFVGLPPIAWNALLSYTLMLLTEDERNQMLHDWAAGRFQAEMQAVIVAAPTSFDLPDSLLGPAEGSAA
jgi:hypothetical protein